MGKRDQIKKKIWWTNPDNRDIQCIPIHFEIIRGPRAPLMRECIPILFLIELNSRSPNQSFNLASPFLILAGTGAQKINQTLGLLRIGGLGIS